MLPLRIGAFYRSLGMALALCVAVGTFFQLGTNISVLEHSRAELTATDARIALLQKLAPSASRAILDSPAGPQSEQTAIAARAAELETVRSTLGSLGTAYQHDGVAYTGLQHAAEAIHARLASLRRDGHDPGDEPATVEETLPAIAMGLTAVEQERLHRAATAILAATVSLERLSVLTALVVLGIAASLSLLWWRMTSTGTIDHLAPNLWVGNSHAQHTLFLERATQTIAASLEVGRTVGVVAVSIAPLAAACRRSGHDVDAMVTSMAQSLRGCFRTADLIARMEDELVVVLNRIGTRSDLAECDARLRRVLDALPMPEALRDAATVKIGHAMYPLDGYSAEELIACARANVDGPSDGSPRLRAVPTKPDRRQAAHLDLCRC